MADLASIITLSQFPTGRRIFAQRGVLDLARRHNLAALAKHAEASVQHDEQTVRLELEWERVRNAPSQPSPMPALDGEVDRLLIAIHDVASAMATVKVPGMPSEAGRQVVDQAELPRVEHRADDEAQQRHEDAGLARADREQRARGARAAELHAEAEQERAQQQGHPRGGDEGGVAAAGAEHVAGLEGRAQHAEHGRGVVVGMLGCFLLGLLWICTYYVFSNDKLADIPVMNDLNQYNLVVGIAFMAVGFTYATKWE